jgi:O-acetyl-ADP-ribose deacetylase (regulator of RNase III)
LKHSLGNSLISLVQGDITRQDTEAIVNAANSSLLGGGGVDGAIHRVGGPRILQECKAIRAAQGECPTGAAVITTGGNLIARYVIHAVGPVWRGGNQGEDELLRSAYRSSLLLAVTQGIRTIAFPSISTGAYGFPVDRAATIAIDTIREFLANNQSALEVRLVTFSKEDFEIYQRAMAACIA